ncbi:hypothetical protein BDP27DRAFT_1028322 [Rhodocollybia butyracea]|uniref:Uncharacterized protein n=1 Tax=Rhodocollybia butyracea TaxID=206335 RepID=A0A9P5UDN3_9AGAR|nr:hypothetical protein BDP27DRAFT_1028322 [Rhodocollybia butyracea]
MAFTIKQSAPLSPIAKPEDAVQTPSLPSSPKMKRSSSSASIVPAVANIFGKIRRGANAISPIHVHGRRLSSSSQSSTHSSSDGETEREIGDSKIPITKTRNTTWTCSSGPAQSNVDPKMKRIDCKDHFICAGGVTLPVLLRATRAMLIETIEGQNGIGMGFRGGKRVILTNEELVLSLGL